MKAGSESVPGGGVGGFTLIELLVVVAIIGVLASLLMPGLSKAQATARKAACLNNLRQVGIAVTAYAQDHDGRIPFGPKAPPFTSPASFYPSTGAPTSLLSLQSGAEVGLGLLLPHYLADQARVLFCPGTDQAVDANGELAKVGQAQAQGSYYYRHAGNTQLFDLPGSTNPPTAPRLDQLGLNRQGRPIRVLAIDTLFLCPPELDDFQVRPRTHHRLRLANSLAADGSVASRLNREGRFTVDLRDPAALRGAFDRILGVLEAADAEP